jgi:hypothetical protein
LRWFTCSMASCSVKPEQVAKTPRWQVSPGQIFRRCFHQPRGSAQGRVNQCFHQSFTPIFSCKIHFPNFQPLVLDSSRSRFPKIVSLKLGFILNSICAWRLVKKLANPPTNQSAHEEGSPQCSNTYAAEIGAQKLPLGHNQPQLLKCDLVATCVTCYNWIHFTGQRRNLGNTWGNKT